jgi:Holliday junction resolvase
VKKNSSDRARTGRNNRRFGAQRERQVIDLLRKEGWEVLGNTHGPYDAIAIRDGDWPRLVEVKSSLKPYDDFGPAKRLELAERACRAGANAWLFHWPKHGSLARIEEKDWPAPPF